MIIAGILLAIAVSVNVQAACGISSSGNDLKCRVNSEGVSICGGWLHGTPCSGDIIIDPPSN